MVLNWQEQLCLRFSSRIYFFSASNRAKVGRVDCQSALGLSSTRRRPRIVIAFGSHSHNRIRLLVAKRPLKLPLIINCLLSVRKGQSVWYSAFLFGHRPSSVWIGAAPSYTSQPWRNVAHHSSSSFYIIKHIFFLLSYKNNEILLKRFNFISCPVFLCLQTDP